MAYYNRIVQVNVSETVAPVPNRLQQTAAIVSMGGTTITAGTTQWIAAAGQLSDYLIPAYDIASISWAAGVVTVVTTNPHGIPIADTTNIVVDGVSVTGYNGNFVATGFDATTLNYALGTDPGGTPTGGTVQVGPQVNLIAADATWWAQGNLGTGYYVYESGTADPADVIDSMTTYLTANPQTIYNWLLLPGMDADHTGLRAFFLLHNTLNALLKFYLPLSVSTYAAWEGENTLRNVFTMIESPGADFATELDAAAPAQYFTAFVPTPTNRLPPAQYTYLNAVTAYTPITQALITTFMDNHINFVATGAEGGISNTILIDGKTLNGTPMNVAYSIDWVQIQSNQAIANAVINGSNNPLSPLYYNQNGIDRLQAVVVQVGNTAIASGLALGQVLQVELDPTVFATNVGLGLYAGNFVVNAVPFDIYTALNPGDYANQLYGGLQVAYTPQYGFETIVFNLNVTQFA